MKRRPLPYVWIINPDRSAIGSMMTIRFIPMRLELDELRASSALDALDRS